MLHLQHSRRLHQVAGHHLNAIWCNSSAATHRATVSTSTIALCSGRFSYFVFLFDADEGATAAFRFRLDALGVGMFGAAFSLSICREVCTSGPHFLCYTIILTKRLSRTFLIRGLLRGAADSDIL